MTRIRKEKQTMGWKVERDLRYWKAMAHKRMQAWDLTDEECRILLTSQCSYCEEPIVGAGKRHRIDLRDPALGFDKANTVTTCWSCHHTRALASCEAEFLDRVTKIAAHAAK